MGEDLLWRRNESGLSGQEDKVLPAMQTPAPRLRTLAVIARPDPEGAIERAVREWTARFVFWRTMDSSPAYFFFGG